MSKKQKETQPSSTPITIDDKEYTLESFTDSQKRLVNHIADLSRKIDSSVFNLEQLEFGKQSFVTSLKASLEEEGVEETVVVDEV